MKLDNIGFYTLSDNRAINSSVFTPLHRGELLLTDRCNFHCPYCRGLQNGNDLLFNDAVHIVNYWISERLVNIRFSGGEPTLYPGLIELVQLAVQGHIKRIALSTNGSANMNYYKQLIEAGVNDFSISLDACCAGTGDVMAGTAGVWEKVIENIKFISKQVYTTVGIVVNNHNIKETEEIILFAHQLGVADIRIIPAAQYNNKIDMLNIPDYILQAHPILNYRVSKSRVRGLLQSDSNKCKLVLDDMAVWNNEHYPCIIYLRENGKPIETITNTARNDRLNWYLKHNTWEDNICRDNCLDVCIEFNNIADRHTMHSVYKYSGCVGYTIKGGTNVKYKT